MLVRHLINQLKALNTPDTEVYVYKSPHQDRDYWLINGMIYCAPVVEPTGENDDRETTD